MSARRYSTRAVTRAREHVAAGWSISKTAKLIQTEFGMRPAITTVRIWTDPDYAELVRRRTRLRERKRWREANKHKSERISPERALERMKLLRENRLSCRAIAIVARLWWGQEITAAQVKAALGGRGMFVRQGESWERAA